MKLFRPAVMRHLLAAFASLAPLLLLIGVAKASAAEPPPASTRIVYAPGKIVPIPASIPHEPGDMVDSRIVPDLRWIAKRYPIFVTDGYSGPLPNGKHVGCDECHVRNSDHYNGVAVDVVPLGAGAVCNAAWAPITRLALWAEPVQNEPVPPFRWIGYDGDAGHGCGNHLHLSWNHAPAKQFELAEWVEVFPVGPTEGERKPRGKRKAKAKVKPTPPLPTGGYSQTRFGGISATGLGD